MHRNRRKEQANEKLQEVRNLRSHQQLLQLNLLQMPHALPLTKGLHWRNEMQHEMEINTPTCPLKQAYLLRVKGAEEGQ